MRLKWNNLKADSCPKCSRLMRAETVRSIEYLSCLSCNFKISKLRAKEIVGDLLEQDLDAQTDDFLAQNGYAPDGTAK